MATPWSWQPGPPPFIPSSPPSSNPCVWHRRVWGPEAVFAAGTIFNPGYADLLISCHVALPPAPPSSASFYHAKAATRALRWSHPAISIKLAWPAFGKEGPDPMQACFTYDVPAGEEDVNEWLTEIVHDRSEYLEKAGGDLSKAVAMLRLELGDAFVPKPAYMFNVHYIGQPVDQKFAVVLQLGHSVFDGIGAFQVLDLWLRELGACYLGGEKPEMPLKWGEEVVRLTRAVPDRAKTSWAETKDIVDRYMVDRVVEAVSVPPAKFGLPALYPSAPPAYTGHVFETIPAPIAENLRKTARTQACRIFSTLLAASYTSLLRLNPPAEGTKNIEAALVPCGSNLRIAHLAGGSASDRSKWEVGSAMGAYAFKASDLERFVPSASTDEVADVWMLAREIQAQVEDQRKHQDTASQWLPEVIKTISKLFFEKPAEPATQGLVDIASLGVIDNSLAHSFPICSTDRSFTISVPIFSLIRFAQPELCPCLIVHSYTWGGMLHLSVSFPAGTLGSEEEQARANGEGKATVYGWLQHYIAVLKQLADTEACFK